MLFLGGLNLPSVQFGFTQTTFKQTKIYKTHVRTLALLIRTEISGGVREKTGPGETSTRLNDEPRHLAATWMTTICYTEPCVEVHLEVVQAVFSCLSEFSR